MNKSFTFSLFTAVSFLLIACDVWTIKNDFKQRIVAGSSVILPGQCVEFIDIFLLGDFPLQFKYQNYHLISKKAYPAGHYLISEEGGIVKQKKACPMEIVGENPLKRQEQISDEEEAPEEEAPEEEAPEEEALEESEDVLTKVWFFFKKMFEDEIEKTESEDPVLENLMP